MRGGVPVFSLPCPRFNSLRRADREMAGGSPARPAGCDLQAHVDLAIEESASRQHHGAAPAKLQADLGDGAHHACRLR